jgi:hypothetical protein
MRFNPDANEGANLLPEGEYEFEVIRANEATSANGNDMIVLRLRAGSNGTSKVVTDYIVSKQIRKVRVVARACGLLDLFDSGEILAEHFLGRKGYVRLAIEKSRNPQYPDRNVVDRYVVRRTK